MSAVDVASMLPSAVWNLVWLGMAVQLLAFAANGLDDAVCQGKHARGCTGSENLPLGQPLVEGHPTHKKHLQQQQPGLITSWLLWLVVVAVLCPALAALRIILAAPVMDSSVVDVLVLIIASGLVKATSLDKLINLKYLALFVCVLLVLPHPPTSVPSAVLGSTLIPASSGKSVLPLQTLCLCHHGQRSCIAPASKK
jgi:hypothetical protein